MESNFGMVGLRERSINPDLNKYWILDYRIYDKNTDGKKKTDHALEMIEYWQIIHELHPERAPSTTILIDAGLHLQKDHAICCP
jgi:hypothetical protein